MRVLQPPVEKQELVFADFVSLRIAPDAHHSCQADTSQEQPMRHEKLFQRIKKERGEFETAVRGQTLVMHVDKRQRGILPNTLPDTLPRRRAG
jgi:hypothetical protein